MANKFKLQAPTSDGWYQVQFGDDDDYKIHTVWVAEAFTIDGHPTGEFCWSWPDNDSDCYPIDPDDAYTRWRPAPNKAIPKQSL